MIGKIVGVPEEDLPQIKKWTDAYVLRHNLAQTEADTLKSAEMEIEMQHYFQPRFESLRKHPDGTFLSELVNTVVPEWGRPMTDSELHGEMSSDLFVGGAETTTNAIAAGVWLLIETPDVWQVLKREPARHLEPFLEEVLRLESPVQGLFRRTKVDVHMHGVRIPAGSLISLRYAAANRDERAFESGECLDLNRRRPRRHLAFGTGAHVCLGAPLARRELYFSFKAIVGRLHEMWHLHGAQAREYRLSYFLRSIKELPIGFTPTP